LGLLSQETQNCSTLVLSKKPYTGALSEVSALFYIEEVTFHAWEQTSFQHSNECS
jgi:hypothetical protein